MPVGPRGGRSCRRLAATIRGHFGDSLAMSLLWMLPAAAWWVAAVLAHRRRGDAEAEAEAGEAPADAAPLHAKVPVG